MDRISLMERRNRQGAALVIVLAFVVLVSGVIVAFLSRAMVSNHLSNSSLNRTEAEQLALSATEIVIGDLKQEIVNGSIATSVAPRATIYRPRRPVNMLPARKAPDAIPNLVRRSGDDPPPPAVHSRASSVSSANESLNGRFISAARWNSHYLIPRPSRAEPTDTEPVPEFSPPDWVMVTSDEGPIGNPSDPGRVVGRYAYAIFDEGELLDVNVAGYPTNAKVNQYGKKPALAYADLTALGPDGLSNTAINGLVGWRNYATAKPNGSFKDFTFGKAAAKDFFDSVVNNTNGFLRVNAMTWNGRTDQAFLSRQQLIDYSLEAQWGHAVNNLQYFGTFSRDVHAPTWSPSTPTPTNPDLVKVRVRQEFARSDGTAARVGEPLLKRRFSLARLATIGNRTLVNGTASQALATKAQRDFGLVWNADHWDYCGPTDHVGQSSIAKISEIGNREPNFFELLKAGILGNPPDLQIIHIGANIIDQYDADSYPTQINFGNANIVYGVEDLPYSFLQSEDGTIKVFAWNPHQPLGAFAKTPTKFRIRTATESEESGFPFEVSPSATFRNRTVVAKDIENRDMFLEYLAPPVNTGSITALRS